MEARISVCWIEGEPRTRWHCWLCHAVRRRRRPADHGVAGGGLWSRGSPCTTTAPWPVPPLCPRLPWAPCPGRREERDKAEGEGEEDAAARGKEGVVTAREEEVAGGASRGGRGHVGARWRRYPPCSGEMRSQTRLGWTNMAQENSWPS